MTHAHAKQAMTLAWTIRRQTGCTMSLALIEAHRLTHERRRRDAMTASRNVIRLNRMRRKAAPVGDVLTRAFDEMGFAA